MTPGIEEVRKFYDDWLNYLSNEQPRHRFIYKEMDKVVHPGQSVLDIGCGTGFTSRHLASVGCKVTAVDLSPRLIEYAKTLSNGIEYHAADITKWDDPRKFDRIVMVDSLEHILPDSLDDLMRVIDRASHDQTVMFLNIPHPEWMKVARENGIKMQIVDMYWPVGAVEHWFSKAGYMPFSMDASSSMYYQMILVRRAVFHAAYRGTLDRRRMRNE